MIPNFAIVGPVNIYRGGQPTDEKDWQLLSQIGVTQVLKLNPDSEGSDDPWTQIGGELFKVPESTWEQLVTEPDLAEILTAVEFMRDGTFVHCSHGQDRTGLLVGAYRLKQGWSKDRAYQEMLDHGFHPELEGLSKAWADLEEVPQ